MTFSLLLVLLMLVWPHSASSRRIVTSVVHRYFHCLVTILRVIGVMRLEVKGKIGRIERGTLVVANHPTYLDIMVLLALIPSACCVVKRAHWRNPCFWGIVRAAGYVSNAGGTSMVEECMQRLAAGYSVIVFPEGTRSPSRGALHPFGRGFAHVALAAQAERGFRELPVAPVALDCDPPVFTKERRWYHVPPRPFRFEVTVLDTVDAASPVTSELPAAVAARRLTASVEAQIFQHLFKHGSAQARN
ncbi:lysophospholipid acyltransferase family protein [Candidatus Burkholderia verschuerenii]|nr:lysophospholipid acyltransferase family protein [Candidatus Burkholderia verschuerenii]